MRKFSTFQITLISLLSALLLIQTYIPLTIIPGAPTITVAHVIVIIGAILLGPRAGLLLGTIWGGLSFFRAVTMPPSPIAVLLFTNPVIAFVPRMVVGWVTGWIFAKWGRDQKHPTALMAGLGVVGAVINTVLVILGTYLFFVHNPAGLLQAFGNPDTTKGLFWVITTLLGANWVTEALTGGILVPLISAPLLRIVARRLPPHQ